MVLTLWQWGRTGEGFSVHLCPGNVKWEVGLSRSATLQVSGTITCLAGEFTVHLNMIG